MTPLQVYLLVAPLVLLAMGAGAAYWWTHYYYPDESRDKPR